MLSTRELCKCNVEKFGNAQNLEKKLNQRCREIATWWELWRGKVVSFEVTFEGVKWLWYSDSSTSMVPDLWSSPVWKTKIDKKKQTYMKTETHILYSGVFWTFQPNVIKIDPYNFELYCLKVGAFLRHSVQLVTHTFAMLPCFTTSLLIASHRSSS